MQHAAALYAAVEAAEQQRLSADKKRKKKSIGNGKESNIRPDIYQFFFLWTLC
jgi:hypothetical protein